MVGITKQLNFPFFPSRATVKMAAFKLLDRVMPKIVADTANVAATGNGEDEDFCELPFRLVSQMREKVLPRL